MLKNCEIKICQKCFQLVSPDKFTSNQCYYEAEGGFLVTIEGKEAITQACSECLNGFRATHEKYFLSKTDFKNRTIITFKKTWREKILSFFKRKKSKALTGTDFTINHNQERN